MTGYLLNQYYQFPNYLGYNYPEKSESTKNPFIKKEGFKDVNDMMNSECYTVMNAMMES